MQIISILEIVHAYFGTLQLNCITHKIGLVKSSPLSTLMQVASRLFISLVCIERAKVYTNWGHAAVVLSWGLADIIRYSYYTISLVTVDNPPRILRWLRYNAFLILYPSGTAGEMYLLYLTWKKWKNAPVYNYGLIALMIIWLPCLVIMYRHMLRQRSRHIIATTITTTKSKRFTN